MGKRAKKRKAVRRSPQGKHSIHRQSGLKMQPTESSPPVRPRAILSGAWGELESYETYLEAPDALLHLLSCPSQKTIWTFHDMKKDRVLELFAAAGLDEKQIRSLSQPERWRDFGRVCQVHPNPDTVFSLSPAARASVYEVLAQWEENPAHRYPIVLESPGPSDALSGLPDRVIEAISGLAYQKGKTTLFSDFPLLLGLVNRSEVERDLLRILTRTRTLLARLRISPESDIESLSRYWSADGKNANPLPLLQSIVLTEGVETLDIAHLMPFAARGKLYTYPGVPDVMSTGRAPDGIWTALNFLNRVPLPLYAHSPNLNDYFTKMFQPVQQPFAFGDLLLISEENAPEPCHACIAVAGDIVYTKNSADFFSPWILSTLERVVQYHVRRSKNAIVRAYRRTD